jgi:hypothetical protein
MKSIFKDRALYVGIVRNYCWASGNKTNHWSRKETWLIKTFTTEKKLRVRTTVAVY